MTTSATRSLYRSVWRALAIVARGNGARAANLRRLYRPQLRDALCADQDQNAVRETIHRTLTLLGSTPALTANLASLAYHHTPYPILNTNTSNRLYSHRPKPVAWNPQDPDAAKQALRKRTRDADRGDPAVSIAHRVDHGLQKMWQAAEQTAQGEVWLGRITPKSHGAS
ncbi:hypothetical protein JCM3774_000338 [Rhodotorula dairenensis]